MNNQKNIFEPIVLFLDDGAHVYPTVRAALFAQEPIDVQNNPKWFGYGYDAAGNGVRLAVAKGERRVFGFRSERDVVKVLSDPELQLTEDGNARQQMTEHLQRTSPDVSAVILENLSAEKLLRRVLSLE